MNTPNVIVTTSWDDGHVLDLKLAQLLERYGLAGTFYVAPHNHEIAPAQRLTSTHIRGLNRRFEVGAHTLTHPRLPQVDAQQAEHEIRGSKTELEAILGRPVTTFCYPGGEFTARDLELVRAAGYRYARTVARFRTTSLSADAETLTAGTTIHAYRHWSDLGRIAQFAQFRPVRTLRYLLNWDELAIALFDRIVTRGGVFHLWGHSWEIDAHGDWGRLEHVFQHISRQPHVRYLTNGELI